MKKLKKQIPIIFYAILFVTIAILCIYIAETADLPAVASKQPAEFVDAPTQQAPLEPESSEPTSEMFSPSETDTLPDVPSETLRGYSDSVPRAASPDDTFRFTQRIYGDGAITLCDVFQTSVGIYTVAETESKNGDLSGKDRCVGIVKTDSYGNIIQCVSLPPSTATSYITAASTAVGFVVITQSKDERYFTIWILSYELQVNSPYRIAAAEDGTIIQTLSSFLFFASYPEETVVYTFLNGTFSFQSIPYGEVVEVFEYDSYYTFFSTDRNENRYSVIRLAKEGLTVTSEVTRNGSILLSVFPLADNGKQCFVTLEKREGTVRAEKYQDAFGSSILTKKIGVFDLKNSYSDGKEIRLVCEGNINGIIVLNAELNTRFSDISSDFIPTSVLDCLHVASGLYYLATDDSSELALIQVSDNTITSQYFPIRTDNARLVLTLENKPLLFYQNGLEICFCGL